jgi:hypothetical protein
MWADVRDGIREAGEVSSVVGLQRVLVLKRLESSPVAFLITLLRLLALHAHRLKQLSELCHVLGDRSARSELDAELARASSALPRRDQRAASMLLLTGTTAEAPRAPLLERWSEAHMSAKAAADDDDPAVPARPLRRQDEKSTASAARAARSALGTQGRPAARLRHAPRHRARPRRPGLRPLRRRDWPRGSSSAARRSTGRVGDLGLRIVTDAKLRRLVARLLRARADGQKVIVFSQFTDTLAYLRLGAAGHPLFERKEWTLALRARSPSSGPPGRSPKTCSTSSRAAPWSAARPRTATRSSTPSRPSTASGPAARTPRRLRRTAAARRSVAPTAGRARCSSPSTSCFATDVLAEGVNLQDAALLINYDVHWNPVRMIQRSGRIDRRLNPAIEDATTSPTSRPSPPSSACPPPRYWWHDHPGAAPITVNLLLPDELEAELQLRERIANKTLAIDFTLGLEQGTGAEADWMAEYRYQGISALNAWQGDRAIEQIAGYQERLRRMLSRAHHRPRLGRRVERLAA